MNRFETMGENTALVSHKTNYEAKYDVTMAGDRTVTNDHQFDDAVNLNLMRQLVHLIG